MTWRVLWLPLMVLISIATSGVAQTVSRGETYAIAKANGSIVVDGRLDDVGWRNAVRIEHWYEIDPGDNIAPPVQSTAYLTYDNKFLYAGFEFDDPEPRRIVALVSE